MSGLFIGHVLAGRKGGVVLSAFLLFTLSITGQLLVSKKGRPFTHEEVAVAWFGVSEDELYLLRVVLNPNGRGMGADSFLDQEPRTFRITAWVYTPPHIAIETVTLSNEDSYELGTLRGKITGNAMHLTVSGKGWNTDYELRREAEWVRRWRALKAAMSEHLRQ